MWLVVPCYYINSEDNGEWDTIICNWSLEWADRVLQQINQVLRIRDAAPDLGGIVLKVQYDTIWMCPGTELWNALRGVAVALTDEPGSNRFVMTVPGTSQLVLPDHFTLDVTDPDTGKALRESVNCEPEFAQLAVRFDGTNVNLFYEFTWQGAYATMYINWLLLQRAANSTLVGTDGQPLQAAPEIEPLVPPDPSPDGDWPIPF